MTNPIEEAAGRLRQARETGAPCTPVRDLIGGTDIEAAYDVQEINTGARLAGGGRLVGRKVGFSNKAIQAQFNVDQPGLGMLFADMDVPDGEEIPWNVLFEPMVEAEIAFVLGEDLAGKDVTMVALIRAIDCALPAFEVVGSRIGGWDIRVTDTIADNVSASHFVLGHSPRGIGGFDPRLCAMTISDGIEPVGTGVGAAVLGSPLNALLWTARESTQRGRPLRAGDMVLSGSLGPPVPVVPGHVYEARIEGLGSVRARFGLDRG